MSDWIRSIDDAWIAWLVFDRPGEKVNTFTESAMAELAGHLDELATDERIKAVAIRSGKRDGFCAGADIGELARLRDAADAEGKSAEGQRVFARLERMPVPTVAVIHGASMGGGTELALACTWRLATDDDGTSIALPEVNLGILPGWGGSQRLPRLLGPVAALGMMLTGRKAAAKKAYRTGLVDGIVAQAFLEEQTRAFVDRALTRRGAGRIAVRRRRARTPVVRLLEATPPGRALIYRNARKEVMAKTHGNYPAPLAIIDLVRDTYRCGTPADGFVQEARAFARLAETPISRNLVHLFEASRRLKRSAAGAKPAEVRHAAVFGAGVMGGGIACALADKGIQVRMRDVSWDAIAKGLAAASRVQGGQVKRRRRSPAAMRMTMHRITGTTDLTGIDKADIVIEAVSEDLELKRRVLREIESVVRPDTIIATNTSSLPLAALASALQRPRRFVGLHFFNPVHRMPLVEIVPGKQTSKGVLVTTAELVRRMGKTPVVVGDCAGFLVNRILLPYLVESAWMLEEGTAADRIDRALERFGMPMGPMTLADEVGLDVGYKVAKVLEEAYGPRMRVAGALDRIASTKGLLGRKSGRGIYRYDGKRRTVNPEIEAIAAAARHSDQIVDRALSDEEIIDRAVLVMVNEAARCLEEGIVDDAEALDMAMVMGTGFAPFRGGLLRYADDRGMASVKSRLDDLALTYGERFRPAALIERLAKKSGRFHSGRGREGGDR